MLFEEARKLTMLPDLVLNVSSDIMIMLIPMPILLKSSLPLKKKLMLSAIFLLGCFTVSDCTPRRTRKPRIYVCLSLSNASFPHV